MHRLPHLAHNISFILLLGRPHFLYPENTCRQGMARKLATSPATPCKRLLIHLLFLSTFRFIQCRPHVSTASMPAHHPLIGLRVDLVHRDSLLSPNITSTERFKQALQRSQERLEKLQMSVVPNAGKLANNKKDLVSQVSAGNGEFLMTIAIGTPSLSYSAILDTGSDLTWTQCKPCSDCYKQSTPIYDPSMSSTYSTVPCTSSLCQALPEFACTSAQCEYIYTYGDYSFTQGILSYETFALSSQSVSKIAFGCGQDNEGSGFSQGGGLVGFGRGPLSFISQVGPSAGNQFSYCLVSVTDSPSKTSPLFVGEAASLNAKTDLSSTPLIQSSAQPTFYYLSLEGISVDSKLLNIPAGTFDLQSDGTGGLIIDSGTTVTYLEQSGYDLVKKALMSYINLPQADGSNIGLDLCYTPKSGSSTTFPTMVFHFKGADYNLPKENYIYVDSSGIICLAMLPSSSMSIFGNMQQQNYQIVYDNGKNTLSFAPTVCDTM